MDTINQTADKIEFASRLSPLVRVVLFLFGLFPLLAPYELLLKPGWDGSFNLIMLIFLIISLGAISVSFFFIGAAFLGRSQHFQFDGSRRQVIYRFKTALTPFSEERYDFNQIEALQLKATTWESRPDSYDICLIIRDERPLAFGDFPSRPEAEPYLYSKRGQTELFKNPRSTLRYTNFFFNLCVSSWPFVDEKRNLYPCQV
jgi:uncharacterized membrane protein